MSALALFEKLTSLEYHEGECPLSYEYGIEATAFEIDPVSPSMKSGRYEIHTWAGNFKVTRVARLINDKIENNHSVEFTEGVTTAFDVDCLLAYLSQEGFI